MNHGWPQGIDLRNDSAFQERIKPFIEREMAALADFDAQRAAWAAQNLPGSYRMNYIFHEHAERVADDMRAAALYSGLGEIVAENLYWAMLPHDIGKRLLPLNLWDMIEKPEDEIKRVRRSHTETGAALLDKEFAALADHPFIVLMRDIMLNHHEQIDGGGFRGLTGDQLSAPVRLACIIESFDGYRIARPHFGDRDISVEGVLTRMRDEKGAALYDMALFEQFAAMKIAG